MSERNGSHDGEYVVRDYENGRCIVEQDFPSKGERRTLFDCASPEDTDLAVKELNRLTELTKERDEWKAKYEEEVIQSALLSASLKQTLAGLAKLRSRIVEADRDWMCRTIRDDNGKAVDSKEYQVALVELAGSELEG